MAIPQTKQNRKPARSEKSSATRRRPPENGSEEALKGLARPRRPRSALELAGDVLENPGVWLRTPNPRLGDRKPIDLIETDEEYKVYNILNAVDQGLFS